MARLLIDTQIVLRWLQGFRWLPLTNCHLLAVAELETHPHTATPTAARKTSSSKGKVLLSCPPYK